MDIAIRTSPRVMDQKELRQFFVNHLNRIYCAKSQLVDKLPELGRRSTFLDLRQAIDETVAIVKLQIRRMRQIYIALDETYQPESCIGLVGILDEAFQSIGIPGETAALCDFSILFYMQNIESIEMSSFKVMILVAEKLAEPGVSQLLLECYDEAREDKILFKEITGKYL
jgi:ferritin-like metal-binding protein YciE